MQMDEEERALLADAAAADAAQAAAAAAASKPAAQEEEDVPMDVDEDEEDTREIKVVTDYKRRKIGCGSLSPPCEAVLPSPTCESLPSTRFDSFSSFTPFL